MGREAFAEELRQIISGYLVTRIVDLVELTHRFEGGKVILTMLVDKPEGGISLEECAAINRELGIIINEKNLIQESYILEVSSPGLDRPLETKSDFSRCLSRKVKVFLYQPVAGKMEFEGEIKMVTEEDLYLVVDSIELQIKLQNIRKGKQTIGKN